MLENMNRRKHRNLTSWLLDMRARCRSKETDRLLDHLANDQLEAAHKYPAQDVGLWLIH